MATETEAERREVACTLILLDIFLPDEYTHIDINYFFVSLLNLILAEAVVATVVLCSGCINLFPCK